MLLALDSTAILGLDSHGDHDLISLPDDSGCLLSISRVLSNYSATYTNILNAESSSLSNDDVTVYVTD
jgi:hypothetical protein